MKTFLSYPSERLEAARKVFDLLQTMKVEVWFDKESLIGGQHWDSERAKAQRDADLILLICSPETVGRAGVIQRELRDALALLKDQPLGHIYLVALRTEEIALPSELDGYQYVDLFRDDWQFRLARSVSLKYDQIGETTPADLLNFISRVSAANNITVKTINEKLKNFELEADYFVVNQGGLYWDYVNAEILAAVSEQYFLAKRNSSFVGEDRTGSWSLQLEKHYLSNGLVSLKFFNFLDLGGAHPTRGIFTKNFGGSLGGKVELKDLFRHDTALLKFIKNYVELDVQRQCLGPDATDGNPEYDLSMYVEEDSYKGWDVFSQWNFDESGIVINLSQYSELPFVMGVFSVSIPWDHFVDKVDEEFADTEIGQFIASKRLS